MDTQALVRRFNSLPRLEKAPSGLVGNHWQFAVHHVPLNPPGDILYLVNPESRFSHAGGPAQILSRPSGAAQAEVVLPLLLNSFVSGLGTSGVGDPPVPAFAPWSWGTRDEDLARALENQLRSVGVREELCSIRIGDKANDDIEREQWSGFVGTLMETMGQGAKTKMAVPKSEIVDTQDHDVCAKCKKAPTDGSRTLQLCGRCRRVKYCSRDCQRADWKEHRRVCRDQSASAGNVGSPGRSVGALEFYNTIAPNQSEAQKLAREIGLTLPHTGGPQQGLQYPIRRLVATGKDTLENILTLAGPNEKDMVERIHKDERIGVLLRPPPGSPMYASAKLYKLDENCPAWSPREPSAAEEEQVRKIRDMQGRIRQYMGSRSMSSINSNDMREILVQNFGAGWSEALPYYQHAVNAMDQEVPVD